MSEFTVDPVIQKLTYQLADWPLSRLFLYNDSRYQWGLLVPRRSGAIEMCDLVPEDQAKLMAEVMALIGSLYLEKTGATESGGTEPGASGRRH